MTTARPENLHRTAIVVSHFGAPPPWFPFFLASCEANPSFEWILYSDFEVMGAPTNVTHEKLSLSDYVAMFEEKLGIDLSAARRDAYKICDMRPAIGYVLADRLAGYDYWGYGDLDVVYGDLAAHFGPQLGTFDVISTHTYLLSGHLVFFRNTKTLRGLFSALPDWRRLMSSAVHVAFDEKQMSQFFFQGMPDRRLFLFAPLFIPRIMVNGEEIVGHFEERFSTFNRPRLLPNGHIGRVEEWVWRDGILTADALLEESLAYAHFSAWASGRYALQRTGAKSWNKGGMEIDPSLSVPYQAFRITETGFHAPAG